MRLLASFVLALSLFACTTFSAEPSPPREQIVKLTGSLTGSGVRLTPGVILTARHVAISGPVVVVDGEIAEIKSVGSGPLDLATMNSAAATCPCVEMATDDARQDEPVVIIGWPQGAFLQVQRGTVQGVMTFPQWPNLGRRVLISASVVPGFSGGGVFAVRDGRWQLVGIITEASDIAALAVPVSDIKQWLGENDGRSK